MITFSVLSMNLLIGSLAVATILAGDKFQPGGAENSTETNFSDVHIPPTFIHQPNAWVVSYFEVPLDSRDTSSYEFRCEATGVPTPTYMWMKDGKPLNLTIPRMKILKAGSFVLTTPQKEDAGVYQCLATSNNATAVDAPVNFTLKYFGSSTAQMEDMEVVHVKRGQSYSRTCVQDNAYPIAKVSWILRSSRRYSMKSINNTRVAVVSDESTGGISKSTIYFSSVEPSDVKLHSWYTCMASVHNIYKFYKIFRFIVADEENPLTPIAPYFLYKSKPRTSAMAGDDVELHCIIAGSPIPKVTWTFDDKPVVLRQYPKNVGLTNHGKTLIVRGIAKGHSGNYRCISGNLTHEMVVSVELSKPSWRDEPTSQNVSRGQKVEIPCVADGNPTPDVEIYRNGKKMSEHDLPYMVTDRARNNKQLFLAKATGKSLTSSFQCHARNAYGQLWKNFYVNVVDEDE